ncbi:uncharacterized protein TRIREDRAFT_43176, partial [Trichoderma reesei QM6a]
TGLPEGAKRTQQLLKEQREREAAQRQSQSQSKSVLKDVWMGGEGEDWKEKRASEHKKAFEEGKGMSDIILEQVAEVFSGNWRGKKDENSADTSQGEKK